MQKIDWDKINQCIADIVTDIEKRKYSSFLKSENEIISNGMRVHDLAITNHNERAIYERERQGGFDRYNGNPYE